MRGHMKVITTVDVSLLNAHRASRGIPALVPVGTKVITTIDLSLLNAHRAKQITKNNS